jgi:nucleotide-binding universal stress UspA family protein
MLSFFLPILTYPDASTNPTLGRAIDLVATLGGHLTVQAVEVDIRDVSNVMADALIDVSAMIASAEATSHARAEELLRLAVAAADRVNVPVVQQRLRSRPESIAPRFATAARTFDYCLIAGAGDGHDELAEATLFGSGGPIILMPDSEVAVHLEVVAVAWDGSPAAARALRDSIPILEKAKKVVVLTVSDDKPLDGATNEALAEQLHRKGLRVEFSIVERGQQSIGECLQTAAVDAGAGFMVMGGYGHNRIREWVLGGATRHSIAKRRVAVLMSH